MIEWASRSISAKIHAADPDGPSVEVMAYGLGFILNFVITIVLAIGFGWVIGDLGDALTAMVAFGVLRSCSGGYHLPSLTLCAVISSLLFAVIGIIQLPNVLLVGLAIISSIIMLAFAPKMREDSNISAKRYPAMKLAATLLPLINIGILNDAIGLAFLAQALLVIPWERGWRKR